MNANPLASVTAWTPLWDRLGVAASVLCILHCVATPALIVFLPLLALNEEAIHGGLAVALAAVSLLAFLPGYGRHGRAGILIVPLIGLALIGAAAAAPDRLPAGVPEWLPTVMGGVLLVGNHLRNLYLCRLCAICCRQGCDAPSAHDRPETAYPARLL